MPLPTSASGSVYELPLPLAPPPNTLTRRPRSRLWRLPTRTRCRSSYRTSTRAQSAGPGLAARSLGFSKLFEEVLQHFMLCWTRRTPEHGIGNVGAPALHVYRDRLCLPSPLSACSKHRKRECRLTQGVHEAHGGCRRCFCEVIPRGLRSKRRTFLS